ncbi:MAG: transglutaminase family protein [Mongoliibacter sp.]|uniref:transglutaminase-like domain-containing protein n=1 Tax=Mongoliibacter sp. TaxID=2022438 RepID=UPI0012F25740|nr:transglutaminase family protein [Mongoliibacter sp.]TVP47352.1 MAG: transglutaminase family protein [Mongoliibacter sp.]
MISKSYRCRKALTRFFLKSCLQLISSIFLLFLSHNFVEAQSSTLTYTFEHPEGVYELPNHQTATYKQEVERINEQKSIVRITIADKYPTLNSTYPISGLSTEKEQYTKPTSHIQSDASEIAAVAQMVKDSTDYGDNLWHLVISTLSWSRSVVRYGRPSDIPTALDAYRDGVANCIGFVHLPAAVLRNMGIPARVVRTLMVRGSRLTRHYLLEVYFPDDDLWITFEPQTLRPPMKGNIAAFVDNNWNQEKHVTSRNFSIDPLTTVRHGLPYQVEPTEEIGQLPRPDWDPYSGQKCIGQALAGYGKEFATMAFGSPNPGPAMNPEAQYEEAEIIFYHPTDDGYDMQVFIPQDYAEGEYEGRGWNSGSWSVGKFTVSGTTFDTKFATPSQEARIFMYDNWAVVRFVGLLGTPDENTIPTRELPGGRSVSGNSLQRGMLMVFHKNESGLWEHHQNIFNPYISESNHFGDGIAFSGDNMFVSAANTRVKESHSGEVLIYKLSNDNYWHHQGALKREAQVSQNQLRSQNRGHTHVRYGHKIAADENRLVVADIDGLHIYASNEEGMSKETYLKFDFGEPDDSGISFKDIENPRQRNEFLSSTSDSIITSLSIDGNRIAAGFGNFNYNGKRSGAVMVVEYEAGNWMQTSYFAPEEIQESNQFGMNVELRGNQLFASAHHMGTSLGPHSGGIYIFEPLENDLWVSTAFLRAENMINNPANPEPIGRGAENLGFDMLLLDDKLLAGAPGLYNRSPAKNYGGIYTFPIPRSAFELQKQNAEAVAETGIVSVEPNPAFSISEIQFEIEEESEVSLFLVDSSGETFQHFIGSKPLGRGSYTLGLDLLNVPPGSHQLILETEYGKSHFDLLRISRFDIESIE